MATTTFANKKNMWKSVKSKLQEIKVKNLKKNHPLFSKILDDSLMSFTDMIEEYYNIFSKSSKKFLISTNEKLKSICNKFIQSEKMKSKEIPKFDDVISGMFYKLTNKMLVKLDWISKSSK